jgi:hypothetical protein
MAGRSGRHWAPTPTLSSKFHGTPALVSWGPEGLDLFALSDDDFLYHLAYANGVWDSTWKDLGSVEADSPPVAVSWGADRLDVFFTTRDSTVMHSGWNGSDWKTWDSLGQLEVAGATSTSSDDVHNPSTTSSAGTTSSKCRRGRAGTYHGRPCRHSRGLCCRRRSYVWRVLLVLVSPSQLFAGTTESRKPTAATSVQRERRRSNYHGGKDRVSSWRRKARACSRRNA